jgi:hypothetical protein
MALIRFISKRIKEAKNPNSYHWMNSIVMSQYMILDTR